MTDSLSIDEINLYDRQIRLWGLDAQKNLRSSEILIINFTGVGVEIIKNLTLGGIGSITILDDSKLKEQDLNSNFFVSRDQVGMYKVVAGMEKIKDMNPRVEIKGEVKNWEELEEDYFKQFDMVIGTGLNSLQIGKLNEITRRLNIPLISCCVHGMFGFIFNDLIKCENWIKLEKNEGRKIGKFNEVSKILKIEELKENDVDMQNILVVNEFRKWNELSGVFLNGQYPTDKKKRKRINKVLISMFALLELGGIYLNEDIEEVVIGRGEMRKGIDEVLDRFKFPKELSMDEEELERFLKHAYCEYQPTNSIIGGVVSQDIINTLVKKELPVNNVCILDGFNSEMPVYNL